MRPPLPMMTVIQQQLSMRESNGIYGRRGRDEDEEKKKGRRGRIEADFKMMTSNDRRALKEAQAWLEDPRANQSRAQGTTPHQFLFITRSFGPVEFSFLPPSTAFALHPRHAAACDIYWVLCTVRSTQYSIWQCHSVQCHPRSSTSRVSLLDSQRCYKVYHGC